MEPDAYHEIAALENTHWWYEGMRRISRSIFLSHIPHDKPLKILDLGCGTGRNITAFTPYGTIFGVDYSPIALSYAAQHHLGRLARGNALQLPYADNAFDMVMSYDVLYHRAVTDDVQALRELQRVVKPGGFILLRLPALDALRGPHDDFVHTARRYSRQSLKTKLDAAGIQPIWMSYANSLLAPLIFTTRKLQGNSHTTEAEAGSDVNAANPVINTILLTLLSIEAWWMRQSRVFPIGVSVYAVGVVESN